MSTTVSVVIDCYNYGSFVAEAIESAFCQTVPAAEIIVVDDGSTDETPRVLEECVARHPSLKIVRQRNAGQLAALVTGLEQVSGDIVCFLDADDKYEQTHIESVTSAFAKRKDVDFVFTAHRVFGDQQELVQLAPHDLELGFSLVSTLNGRQYVGSITSTLAIRRNLVLSLLPVLRQAAPRWKTRADDCIVYGASLAGSRKSYIAAPTVLYRAHGSNLLLNQNQDQDYMHAHGLRRDMVFGLFTTHFGIGPAMRWRLVGEFRSIQRPTLEQYRLYCQLNHKVNRSLLLRLKERVKLKQHYAKNKATW